MTFYAEQRLGSELRGRVEDGTDHFLHVGFGRPVVREAGSGRRATRKTIESAVVDVLSADGYEPRAARDGLVLTNCPFHALAQEETELVCGMNLAYLQGVLDVLGVTSLDAKLDPAEGRCCVRLQKR